MSLTVTPTAEMKTLTVGDEIYEVVDDEARTDIEDIKEDLTDTTDLSSGFTAGYYIATNVTVGETVDTTLVSNSGFKYQIVPVLSGDVFVLTVTGGTTPRAWALTDIDYKLLSKATTTSVSGTTVTASADGYLILNSTTASTPSITRYRLATVNLSNSVDNHETRITTLESKVETIEESIDDVTHITDPHKLNWVMKSFSASGVGGAIYTNRMCTWCKVKAGGTVVATTCGGNTKVSFGYKVDDDQTALDAYTSYGYSTYTVEQDCTIYIGVLYNQSQVEDTTLYNDSILDGITIDLDVVDYVSKYSKKDSAAFGNPVDVYYEGQHTDETGFTNATTDIDAVHGAFDALVTASNGYVTKTDLGEAYSTYHMYQYDTLAVPSTHSSLTVPKVAIICCEHGNEKMSAYAMHYLLHDLVYKSTKNPVLSYLRSNCHLTVIPIANPWGFINTSRWNENGVNLNRNFPTYNWDDYSTDTSGVGGINYKGASAASEDQTKMLMAFLRSNYDAVFAVDLHTNGENTDAAYEICATIIPEDSDTTSADYAVQNSYVEPARVHTNRIKPWLDETYGTSLGDKYYGAITAPEEDRPTTAQWIRESNNMMGFTFEVLAGSTTEYLGSTLTKYAPATIKAAAEEIGNFLVAMLMNCKNV